MRKRRKDVDEKNSVIDVMQQYKGENFPYKGG